jgi:replication initiation and membrane attachment protein DnaB
MKHHATWRKPNLCYQTLIGLSVLSFYQTCLIKSRIFKEMERVRC